MVLEDLEPLGMVLDGLDPLGEFFYNLCLTVEVLRCLSFFERRKEKNFFYFFIFIVVTKLHVVYW